MPFIQCAKSIRILTTVLLLIAPLLSIASAGSETPHNVILFIGDGMDDEQITIARNYLKGARGRLAMDDMPIRSAVQVLTVDEYNPHLPVYVADSANSATAIATGVVTSRGRIATSAKNDEDLQTITELAKASNLRTGIVSTASITDATPAAFAAHVSNRGCQTFQLMTAGKRLGDIYNSCEKDLKSNGGAGSIVEQISNSSVDIYLGGGLSFFQQTTEDGKTSLEKAAANGYQIIQNHFELNNLKQPKVIGLFADEDIPAQLMGENDQIAEVLKFENNNLIEPGGFACVENPKVRNIPSLSIMTETAINHLSNNNDKGFFLIVESSNIDNESHLRRPCGSIGGIMQLDEALQVALEFSKRNVNTLILVTADHGSAAKLIPYPSLFKGMPKAHSIGHLAVLKTPEGSLLGVNYATNEAQYEEHSGTQVPLMINKPVVSHLKSMIAQPQLFFIMRDYLGL